MFELIALGLTLGSVFAGYFGARRFVSQRLRFVDAGTAILFGAGVGAGVRAGRRVIRLAEYRIGSGF